MAVGFIGKLFALLTIHGDRLGITVQDANGRSALILDGFNIGGQSGINYESGADAVVALAGGGQSASAPVLSANVNRIGTVATTSDSVLLPPLAGAFPAKGASINLTVINAAANAAAIFPSSGDKINALGANASLASSAGAVTTFFSTSSANGWVSK